MSLRIVSKQREDIVTSQQRPTDSAHASTVLELKDGSFLAAWFGGSWEKDPNVAIWTATRSKEGTWSYPRKVDDVIGVAQWNPVLFRLPNGNIMLFFKVGATIPEWQTYVRESDDEGKTWSERRELVPGDTSGGRGPVKNKPVLLSDGKTIVAPASKESEVEWDAFVDISRDNGTSWERSEFVPVRHAGYNIQEVDQPYEKHRLWGKGMIQPSLWEDEKGLHMFCRTNGSWIFRSDSTDGGRSWSLAYDTGLANNNSGLDLVRMRDGVLVLCCNPVHNLPGYYKGPRTPLSLLYSEDDGDHWKKLCDLEDGQGDYCYPAIIQAQDGSLCITYTWRRERIVYWNIKVERR